MHPCPWLRVLSARPSARRRDGRTVDDEVVVGPTKIRPLAGVATLNLTRFPARRALHFDCCSTTPVARFAASYARSCPVPLSIIHATPFSVPFAVM